MSAELVGSAAPRVLTLPDLVTLAGLGLGLWWASGGPSWAGLVSVLADEVDGRLARAAGAETLHGDQLDWGVDVALTPLALVRLSREAGYGDDGLWLAPLVMLFQARLRSERWRPAVGSARAAAMLAAIALHEGRR